MKFKAFGKLLITGEYLVLKGAKALALPATKMTQNLSVNNKEVGFSWRALDEKNQVWLEANFDKGLQILTANRVSEANLLQEILGFIRAKKPELFSSGLSFETSMNFSREWGLGSSSTLITLLAQWSEVDAFLLQKKFFKGSGYDVACATHLSPILYQLESDVPRVTEVYWQPSFKDQLYFVYLGKKQNSRDSITTFDKSAFAPTIQNLAYMNELTNQFLQAQDLTQFQNLMTEHETFLSSILGMPTVKERLFLDFPGAIKSLGGWGGDIVMVASEKNPEEYFKSRNYPLMFKWDDLN